MARTIEKADELSTRNLLGAIIKDTLKQQGSVKFLVARGQGQATMSRVRMELTRTRKRLEKAGRNPARFTLKQTIIPWTESGKTHDCVIVRCVKNSTHANMELLEDMISAKGVEL